MTDYPYVTFLPTELLRMTVSRRRFVVFERRWVAAIFYDLQ